MVHNVNSAQGWIGHSSSDSATWDRTDTPLPHKAKETTQHQPELMERIIFNELPRAKGCESGEKDLDGESQAHFLPLSES